MRMHVNENTFMDRAHLFRKAVDTYRSHGLKTVGGKICSKTANLLFRSNAAVWFGRDLAGLVAAQTGTSNRLF